MFCDGSRNRVLIDSVGRTSFYRPPSIEGYIPDAHVALSELGRVIIGEAKSFGDLESPRTEAQVTAFLRRCGMAQGSVFVLAVPWPLERHARDLLNKFQGSEELRRVETVVLSEANTLGRLARCKR